MRKVLGRSPTRIEARPMIRIACPICGTRSETEFSYGGDATVRRPDDAETAAEPWLDYVFNRDNPRGWYKEYWHHVQGAQARREVR